MAFLPDWSILNVGLTVLQLLQLGVGFMEVQTPTGYSKFAEKVSLKRQIPSQVGMLIAYLPALVYCFWDFVLPSPGTPRVRLIAAICLMLHFLKRVLEVLCVHVYSGSTGLEVMAPIGCFYCFYSAAILHSSSSGAEPREAASLLAPVPLLGFILFLTGQLGNLYHHFLLAQFRTSPSKAVRGGPGGRYVLPSGGLFNLLTMPHYSCELVAWYGLVFIVPRLNILLVAVGMTSYLAGRSAATTSWYKEQFGTQWPSNRKHLIPFIF